MKEVQWYVLGTKPALRRFLASRLISKLSGSARLLAMTWQLSEFDNPNGVKVLLSKLQSSPLVRKSLPNAAAIMGQYFAFRRNRGENISGFLIREALHYEEFRECLIRLKEDQLGRGPEANGFGLPVVNEDDSEDTQDADARSSPAVARPRTTEAGAASPASERPTSERPTSERPDSVRYSRVPTEVSTVVVTPAVDETVLSITDSFILEQLRGWRLLTSASLSSDEWRDVLGTTQGKLDYQSISDALQVLYDEQMNGASRHQFTHHPASANTVEAFAMNGDDEEDWSWDDTSWSSSSSWTDDAWNNMAYYDDDWWWQEEGNEEHDQVEAEVAAMSEEPSDEVGRMDQLLAEQRSWSQAHKSSAAMKKDRGFGKGACYSCGSYQHFTRECPDRQAPHFKGKGKNMNYAMEDDWWNQAMMMAAAMMKGKSRGKGKGGKDLNYFKGKGKRNPWNYGGKGNGKNQGKSVNAYAMNHYGLEMEVQQMTALPAGEHRAVGPESGMVDSGATCSAGPESSVQRLIASILTADSGAKIDISTKATPRFRYGSGKWGQALYKVTISSKLSGSSRSFSCFALPDPEEVHQDWFTPQMLVPVLVGMDWLGPMGAGAILDHTDGHCCLTNYGGTVMQLPKNQKSHYFLDVGTFLTEGKVDHGGSARVHVMLADSEEQPPVEQQTLEFLPLQSFIVNPEVDLMVTWMPSDGPSMAFQEMCERRLSMSRSNSTHMGSLLSAETAPTSSSRSSHADLFGNQGDQAQGDQVRFGESHGNRPSRPSSQFRDMALHGIAPTGSQTKQPLCGMAAMSSMRSTTPLLPGGGRTCQQHGEPKCRKCPTSTSTTSRTTTRTSRTNGGIGSCDDREGDLRRENEDYVGELSEELGSQLSQDPRCREPRIQRVNTPKQFKGKSQEQGLSRTSGNPVSKQLGTGDTSKGKRVGTSPGVADPRGKEADHPTSSRPCTSSSLQKDIDERDRTRAGLPVEKTWKMPLRIGKGIMAMIALLNDQLVASIANIAYDKPPVVWEMFCSPESMLTKCVNKEGLTGVRINLAGGFDLYKKDSYVRLHALRQVQRPKKYWVSTPCTAYCDWSELNYHDRWHVLEGKRRTERQMHRKVIAFILDGLEEDDSAELYWEWPLRCRAWKEAHIKEFQRRLEEILGRRVFFCRIDGCRYGMKSAHGGNIKKSWLIMTTDEVFYSNYRLRTCLRNHPHEQVHGIETNRSAYYPEALCRSIALTWRKQLVPERWINMLWVAPVIQDPFIDVYQNEIFNPDLCPALPDQDQPGGVPLSPVQPDGDLPGDIGDGEPEPSDRERELWRNKIIHFHKAAGHATPRNMARMMADAHLPRWKIKMTLDYKCPVCAEVKPGGISSGQISPASTRQLPAPWEQIGIDVAEWEVPGVNLKVKFVMIMDMATRYKVTEVLFETKHGEIKVETGEDMVRVVTLRWLSDKPRPKLIVPDNAKSLTSMKFVEHMGDLGISVFFPPAYESWAHGMIERGIQIIKETATIIHKSMPDQHVAVSLALATSAVNSTEYVKGFSSLQWVFGRQMEITDEEFKQQISIPEHRQQDQFIRLMNQRQMAEECARKARALSTISKLKNTSVKQPWRTFNLAEPVMVWRKYLPPTFHKGKRGGLKKTVKPRWVGPGRVVLHELIPGQHEDDRKGIVWVVIGNTLYRCSVHSVRPLSEREGAVHDLSTTENPSRWKQLSDLLPRREYVDIENEIPGDDEIEFPDLEDQPPERGYLGIPTVRFGRKQPVNMDGKPGYVEMVNDYDYEPESPYQPPGHEDRGQDSSWIPQLLPRPPEQPHRPETLKTSTEDEDLPALPETEGEGEDPESKTVEPDSKRARLDSDNDDSKDDLYLKHQQILDEIEEGYVMNIDIEFNSNRQRKMFLHSPHVYLAKKMAGSEVVYRKLTSNDKKLFDNAKDSEVSSFLRTEAVRRCLDYEEHQEAKRTGRVLKSRWVLVWKKIPEESREDALKDARENPKTTHTSDGSKKAKARIVVLGYQHPDLLSPSLATTAPVQCQLTRNLALCVAAQRRWQLESLDMSTAFLQTGKTEEDRKIWMHGVPELNEGLGAEPHEVLRILKNVYGNATAPRGLWADVDQCMQGLGARRLVGDASFWVFTVPNENPRNDADKDKLIGFIGGHVDDFQRAGDLEDDRWIRIRDAIDKAYKWGSTKVNQFRYTGLDIAVKQEGNDRFIEMDQNYYIEGIPDLNIRAERLQQDDGTLLTPDEHSACRAGLGALQWIATQTQVQICARTNLLLSQLSRKNDLSTAKEIQDLIREVRANPVVLRFWSHPEIKHWQDAVIVTLADQAHSNRAKGDSTGGLLTMVGGPDHLNGYAGRLTIVGWRTWKLQRKAISTNDAEVQAMLEGEDSNYRARYLWAQINGYDPSTNLLGAANHVMKYVKGIVGTDSKGGFDAVMKAPLLGLSNIRSSLQAYQLREHLEQGGALMIWLGGDWNLSDALTKKPAVARQGLLQFLKNFVWRLQYDPAFITSERKAKQAGRGALQQMRELTALIPDLSWLRWLLPA